MHQPPRWLLGTSHRRTGGDALASSLRGLAAGEHGQWIVSRQQSHGGRGGPARAARFVDREDDRCFQTSRFRLPQLRVLVDN